ncbi:ubiquinone biosynthesis monooxygenase Coq7 [Fusarium beomiforme]|uniref:5-demethoxyubiquinone hydroxylase, mitochondrial n=1 Tax=Fusarium beomiforme TaxID=44412 RepID=A0A9P5DQ48_9HYPO|nr:ubiquinone biosynthesis monooxygenase Coq7 [Fusarium beomiforme]
MALRSFAVRLTPSLYKPCIRTIATTPGAQASVTSEPPKKLKPLTQEQRDFLDSALRVNQAGELAAVLIYAAQSPILLRSKPHLRKLMAHMYDQEDGHFKTFNSLIHKHRIRPTALYPLWSVMATGLGWSTAMMGYEAAMACTEAVETEIGGHYNEQIRTLLEMITQWEAEGYEVGKELSDLVKTLRVIRDEELEHLDHAVEHDAQKAEPHWLLTGVIRAGCRGAIWRPTLGWLLRKARIEKTEEIERNMIKGTQA